MDENVVVPVVVNVYDDDDDVVVVVVVSSVPWMGTVGMNLSVERASVDASKPSQGK